MIMTTEQIAEQVMALARENCGRCRFALDHEAETALCYCRRNPPQHTMADVVVMKKGGEVRMTTRWQFPLMFKSEGWCGEFKDKEA